MKGISEKRDKKLLNKNFISNIKNKKQKENMKMNTKISSKIENNFFLKVT